MCLTRILDPSKYLSLIYLKYLNKGLNDGMLSNYRASCGYDARRKRKLRPKILLKAPHYY